MHRRACRGITITEALVASSILVIMSVIFAAITGQVRTSSEGGSKKIEIRAIHRETQQRLALIFRRAIAPNEIDPAIVSPDPQQSGEEVRFHAPLDLLDPEQAFDPRNPEYPEFNLRFNPAGGCLVISKTDGTGVTQRIGRGLSQVRFHRAHAHTLEITLESVKQVRGASAGEKKIRETSKSVVRLPGAR
ncbi:MAG: hypothetical protein WC314_24950 [Vulcanimicrobiota bacterium]